MSSSDVMTEEIGSCLPKRPGSGRLALGRTGGSRLPQPTKRVSLQSHGFNDLDFLAEGKAGQSLSASNLSLKDVVDIEIGELFHNLSISANGSERPVLRQNPAH